MEQTDGQNYLCIYVFRQVGEGTGGPNPLKGRQRTCDSSGVYGCPWAAVIAYYQAIRMLVCPPIS